MKVLALCALWSLAAVLAAGVLWRIARRKKVVLRGRWSPRVVQMVAAIVVALSPLAPDDPALADEAPASQGKGAPDVETSAGADAFPSDARAIKNWRRRYAYRGSHLERFKQAFAPIDAGAVHPADKAAYVRAGELVDAIPGRLSAILAADLAAQEKGVLRPVVPAADLVTALQQLERQGCFDMWLLGYVWRTAARRPAAARHEDIVLYQAMRRYARLVDVMILAQGKVKAAAFQPRAWMSKAGPSPKTVAREKAIVTAVLLAAAKVWPTLTATSWSRDAYAELGLAKGSSKALLRRGARTLVLQAEDTLVRFGRLDLLEAPKDAPPVTLTHAWLGEITLPAGRTYSVWDLPAVLSTAARARLHHAARKALRGDEQAAGRLESTLPLSHAALRRALAEDGAAPGAARVRTILSLFEERIVRVMKK